MCIAIDTPIVDHNKYNYDDDNDDDNVGYQDDNALTTSSPC